MMDFAGQQDERRTTVLLFDVKRAKRSDRAVFRGTENGWAKRRCSSTNLACLMMFTPFCSPVLHVCYVSLSIFRLLVAAGL